MPPALDQLSCTRLGHLLKLFLMLQPCLFNLIELHVWRRARHSARQYYRHWIGHKIPGRPFLFRWLLVPIGRLIVFHSVGFLNVRAGIVPPLSPVDSYLLACLPRRMLQCGATFCQQPFLIISHIAVEDRDLTISTSHNRSATISTKCASWLTRMTQPS